MDISHWNTLHDGEIMSAERDGETVRLVVEIAYLCHHLPTEGDAVAVILDGCTRFEWAEYDEEPIHDTSRIRSGEITILSAGLQGDHVLVECVAGQLRCAYATARIETMEGLTVPAKELEASADRYWEEWETTNRLRAEDEQRPASD